jgi:hypothetical protein
MTLKRSTLAAEGDTLYADPQIEACPCVSYGSAKQNSPVTIQSAALA